MIIRKSVNVDYFFFAGGLGGTLGSLSKDSIHPSLV